MKHRVPCAPVRDLDEVVNDRHMHARRALEWVDHPLYGRMCLTNSASRFDGGAGRDTVSLNIEAIRKALADAHQLAAGLRKGLGRRRGVRLVPAPSRAAP